MTDTEPSSRSPRPARRPAQESPLVWGLLVAVLFLAFVNFLFVAVAAPSAYRIGLAVAAGAFFALSVVLFVRSSRERRRARGAASGAPADGIRAGADADGVAGHGPRDDVHDPRDRPAPGRTEDGPAA